MDRMATHRHVPRIEQDIEDIGRDVGHLVRDIFHPHHCKLTSIKIQFRRSHMSTPTVGPVVLTAAGQTATASVIGYDQFGEVFEGNFNPTFSASDTAGTIATFNATTGLVTAVGNGVDSITATVQTTDASGNPVTLSDTETVTVSIAQPVPVLTTIKVAFAQPDGQNTPPPTAGS